MAHTAGVPDPVDVGGAAAFADGVPPELGSTSHAHGGALRCELASEWLHVARRSAGIRPRHHGIHAADFYGFVFRGSGPEATGGMAGSIDRVRRYRLRVVWKS